MLPEDVLFGFAQALFLTWLSEAVVVYAISRNIKLVYYSLLCNAVTNPLCNLICYTVYIRFGLTLWYISILICELSVYISEVYLYRYFSGLKLKKCVILSLASNTFSLLLGILIGYL